MYYTMIVVNPRNQGVKSAIFRMRFGIFSTLGLCNFFLVLFSGDPTVESERSREVGLHKVPFFFIYNQPEPRYFD